MASTPGKTSSRLTQQLPNSALSSVPPTPCSFSPSWPLPLKGQFKTVRPTCPPYCLLCLHALIGLGSFTFTLTLFSWPGATLLYYVLPLLCSVGSHMSGSP